MSNRKYDKLKATILIIGLSMISFYTSFDGFRKLSNSTDNYIMLIPVALFVILLQSALVFSINRFYLSDIFKREFGIKAILLLLTYLMTTSISIFFSFSFYYQLLSANKYATRSTLFQLHEAKDILTDSSFRFHNVYNSLKSLSIYSTNKSMKEKQFGYTCNSQVGRGEGVYTWLRADDAKLTANFLNDIKGLEKNLNREIAQITQAISQFDPQSTNIEKFGEIINSRIKRINSNYLHNPILNNLVKTLKSRSGANRAKIRVLNRNNNAVSIQSCMDSSFTYEAQKVINAIESLKSIEKLEIFDPKDTNKLFERTINVFSTLLTNPSSISSNATKFDDVTSEDLYSIFFAIMVDLLILFLTIYAKGDKPMNLPSNQIVKQIIAGKSYHKVMNILRPYITETHKNYLVAIPNQNISKELIDLVEYLKEQKLLKFYIADIKGKQLLNTFSNKLKTEFVNQSITIYQAPKERFQRFITQSRGI